jgi:RNA polymerase sigma-70 factor, ECF subfamily
METSGACIGRDDPDALLADRARAGSREAFAAIVQRHEGRVYRLALRMSGYHHDAEDIAQETFLLAYGAIGSFRGSSKLRTWLCQIATNAALMRKRSAKRRPTVPFDETILPPSDDLTDELLARRRQAMRAVDVIEGLDDNHRAAFVLCDLEGMRGAEAAEVLSTSAAAVRQRAYRARRIVRERLAGIDWS